MKILKQNLQGETTWQYDGEALERGKNFIIIEAFFNRDDLPFQDIVMKRDDRFVETYYADKWYNIFEIYDRDDGRLKGWYCNLTKPAVIDDDSIAYVDLALDLWVNADGAQKVLDEDEFEALNLDEETKKNVWAGLRELQIYFESKNPPR
ncbi:MAG: DUF402 domain-containing protein [Anaerolineales bacterium]|nr:DUF402 domain-containing protein [Anaerolineales bacterium]